jgi:hypothetical protein
MEISGPATTFEVIDFKRFSAGDEHTVESILRRE